jgi:hypothetical protein
MMISPLSCFECAFILQNKKIPNHPLWYYGIIPLICSISTEMTAHSFLE